MVLTIQASFMFFTPDKFHFSRKNFVNKLFSSDAIHSRREDVVSVEIQSLKSDLFLYLPHLNEEFSRRLFKSKVMLDA